MKVAVHVAQRGKYIHRVYGDTGRLLGVVNAGTPPYAHFEPKNGRTHRVWYAVDTQGRHHTGLADLDHAVAALVTQGAAR
jgi:hypothetical protein